ncbi:hypothetical protein CCMA1212_001781 [Trichoderma ghanense]|uniref:Uncharacterized protein n=1 Tax=Trichoderma ghanense TaxID=65468 RepID=A0ABY2HEA7_9HYPO
MDRRPIKARADHASHWRGPALGLNQPVTGVKSALAPPPLKSYLRIFPRPLSRSLAHSSPPSTNHPAVARPAALPCPTNEQRKSKPVQRAKKGPFPPSRVQSHSIRPQGSKRNNHAASSLASHSDSTILVPIRSTQSRAPVAAASKGKPEKKGLKLTPVFAPGFSIFLWTEASGAFGLSESSSFFFSELLFSATQFFLPPGAGRERESLITSHHPSLLPLPIIHDPAAESRQSIRNPRLWN